MRKRNMEWVSERERVREKKRERYRMCAFSENHQLIIHGSMPLECLFSFPFRHISTFFRSDLSLHTYETYFQTKWKWFFPSLIVTTTTQTQQQQRRPFCPCLLPTCEKPGGKFKRLVTTESRGRMRLNWVKNKSVFLFDIFVCFSTCCRKKGVTLAFSY